MLEPIVESVRARLPRVIDAAAAWDRAAAEAPLPPDFAAAIRSGSGLGVIAEVKRRSPSAGPIAPDLDPVTLAASYEAGGAVAISVLTEPDHFGGSPEDLATIAAASVLPLLRKDFILHPAQISQARALGASAVLLIVAILDDADLAKFVAAARRVGLAALVEVHDEGEVVRALAAGAEVIGVNNRDLTTFRVDLGTAERLRGAIPSDVAAVAESGVTDVVGARRMADAGYDAILVGQAAAQAPDPATFIAALRAGA